MKKNKISKRKIKKYISIIIAIIAIIYLLVSEKIDIKDLIEQSTTNEIYADTDNTEETSSILSNNESDFGSYKVVRVVDGDTIVVEYNGNNEKVRLIGIDTPESVHPDESKNTEEGVLASDFTKAKLNNKYVGLEFDVQERDKYGRLLAYVYLDGYMFNKTLLEEGYAKLATYPPNVKYVDDFTKLQKEARESKVGIWK